MPRQHPGEENVEFRRLSYTWLCTFHALVEEGYLVADEPPSDQA